MNYLLQNKVNYLPDPKPVVIWTLSGGIESYSTCENIAVYSSNNILHADPVKIKYVFDGSKDGDYINIHSPYFEYYFDKYIRRQYLIINIILSFKCKDITKIKDGDTIYCTCSMSSGDRELWHNTYTLPVEPSYINTFNIVDCIPKEIDQKRHAINIDIYYVNDEDNYEIIYNNLKNPTAPLFQCL